MKLRNIFAIAMSLLILTPLFGCASESDIENTFSTHAPLSDETKPVEAQTTVSNLDGDDIDTHIILNDKSTVIKGKGVSFENSVVTISEPGNYLIKGKLSDGQIIVNSENENKKVCLYLDGINIYCSSGAPIHVESSPKGTQIILSDGSKNILSDNEDRDTSLKEELGNSFATATVYSRDDLVIGGKGTLTINANFNKGVFSRDSLKITGGIFDIKSADDAIRGKDSVEIQSGTFNLDAGGDAIRTSNEDDGKGNIIIANGNFTVQSSLDSIQATGSIAISGGHFNLKSGGGFNEEIASSNSQEDYFRFGRDFPRSEPTEPTESDESSISAKGIKADGPIAISGGEFELDCLDDAIHTNNDLAISGGKFTIKSNDDAIHSDKTLAIAFGTFDIQQSYEGIEAQSIAISGGKIKIVSSDDGLNAASSTSDDFSISFNENNGAPKGEGANDTPPRGEGANSGPGGKPFMFSRKDDHRFGGRGGDQYDENCQIKITGGEIVINAGGDGLDSNGDIYMSGGKVVVSGSVDGGNAAIDYSGKFTMDGGTIAATGDLGMAQSISDGRICVINIRHNFPEGAKVKITDSKNNEMYSFTAQKSATNLIFADQKLSTKDTYNVYIGETLIETVKAQSAKS